jgi:flagellar biosynthetic protein FlhB
LAESGFQERTEKATPKKRRDAREKGRVARSMEVNSFSVLLAGALAITFLGSYSGTGIEQLFDHIFRNLFSPGMDPESIETLYISVLMKFVLVFAPFALFLTVAALASNFLQVGFIFSADPVTPKLEKISPIKGFGRIFSKETLMELFKSFVKIGAIGLVAYITVKNELGGFFQLADSDLSSLVESIRRVTLLLLFRSILVIAIIAVLDFAFQKYSFEEKLKMTKQEVKEEYKETEETR